MENEPNIVYVCFWCNDHFQVDENTLVDFRIGMDHEGKKKYVPSCPKCSEPEEDKNKTVYLN